MWAARFGRNGIVGRWSKSGNAASAELEQTVRKLAIYAKTVDRRADFPVQSNFEQSEASKIDAKVRTNVRPREFSHRLQDLCATAEPALP